MPRTSEICKGAKYSNTLATCTHETGNLVSIQNNQVVTTSLQIADAFGRLHNEVLKSIRALECSELFRAGNFTLSCYTRKNGNVTKSYPMYYLTRDGFTFLAMGFTGKIAARFKEAYINAFNEMEKKLAGETITEKAMSDLIDKLCGKIEGNMNAQEKKLEKLFGMKAPVSGIFSPVYCRNNTIEERLTDIFATLNNNIMSGMFAWSKLEFIEKKTEGMRKTAAEFASKFLNYYY